MPHNSETVTVTKTKTATTVIEGATDVVSVSAPGKPGPAGSISTMTVGTVTTGVAAATITGTAADPILNLVMPSGTGQYKHTQGTPATTWTIDHNLGYEPGGVAIVDSGGTIVTGTVTYSSVDRIVVSFTSAFGGKAYIS
tara:strand:- start:300 stop:719 length:420 start_codon:yes stop_codon:yes gene_type:complete